MTQGCSLRSSQGRWILLGTVLASSAAFLMGTAVVIILPTIQRDLNVTISGIQWVVNAHLLTLSALLLLGGAFGDRFGRKKVFILGISIFITGAVLSGISTTIEQLISFQSLQGIGAAFMIPQSLAIINVCFIKEERGKAVGLWAGLSGGIAAAGPYLSGWLVESISWRAVFFMTVPICILALVVTSFFIPGIKESRDRRLDWLGTVFILTGLFGLVFGLIYGPGFGWDRPLTIIPMICGFATIALFVYTESHVSHPLVPPLIFKNPGVAGANTVTLFLYFSFNGLIFFLTLNLQQIQGFSPVEAGLGLLPPIVLITLLSIPSGALADKIGPRIPMTAGPVIVAMGMVFLAASGTNADYLKDFLPGLILFGCGMALVIPSLVKCALDVGSQHSGTASGINNAVSRMAGLLAIAVLGAVMVSSFTTHLHDIIQTSSLSPRKQEQILNQSDKLGGVKIPECFNEEDRRSAEKTLEKSYIYGFRLVMFIGAGLALLGGLVSIKTIPKRLNGEVSSG